MSDDIIWKVFERTGSINAYVMYKQQQDELERHDGVVIGKDRADAVSGFRDRPPTQEFRG